MENDFHTVKGYEIKSKAKITPAMEDYLEMIYRYCCNNQYIRVKELSKLLNVRDSSVSKMVQKLGEMRFINYEKYGVITLSKKGKTIGSFLLKRHEVIEIFLKQIGCRRDILIQTELIEHVLTYNTIKKIDCLNIFLKDSNYRYQQKKSPKTL